MQVKFRFGPSYKIPKAIQRKLKIRIQIIKN